MQDGCARDRLLILVFMPLLLLLMHELHRGILKAPFQRASIRLFGNVIAWAVDVKTSFFAATVVVSSA